MSALYCSILMFCQISGFCFYKTNLYKAFFLKTFNLTVSLIAISFKWFLQKQRGYYFIHIFHKSIFRLMYFIDEDIFLGVSPTVDSLTQCVFRISRFRIAFIVSLSCSENINTRFSSRTWTAKNKIIFLIHYFFIQERLGIIWNKIYTALNYVSSKIL